MAGSRKLFFITEILFAGCPAIAIDLENDVG
jgi:hypothetical protein